LFYIFLYTKFTSLKLKKTTVIMRKTILFAFAFSISSFVFSQTNNNQKIEKAPRENSSGYCASCPKSATNVNNQETISQLPTDFPVFIDTGNKKQDLANFHDAKQKWIKENPERFKKIQKLNLNESIPTDL